MTYPITQRVGFSPQPARLRPTDAWFQSVADHEHRHLLPARRAVWHCDDVPLICATGVSSTDEPIALYRSSFPADCPPAVDLQRSDGVTQTLALAGIRTGRDSPRRSAVATAVTGRPAPPAARAPP
jgi:hypothetical protein